MIDPFIDSSKLNYQEFTTIVREVQEFISSKYSTLISSDIEEQKEQVKMFITKYLQDNLIAVEGLEFGELVEKLYSEMAEFSVLTPYLFASGIEEININSWDDISITQSDGKIYKSPETFESPQHALDIVRKMLRISGEILDNTSPTTLGYLSKNVRIAAMKDPIVDPDVGVSASIRIVNAIFMTKSELVSRGTATEEILDFLSLSFRYGASMCIGGSTNSGKTTLTNWILSTVPNEKRIFTIESGSRELNLVKRNDLGVVENNIVHTLSRASENPMADVCQSELLSTSLRYNPDFICVGEMRGPEAFTAQEAARTGHTVISTVHSNSCEATWRRIFTMIKTAFAIEDKTAMDLVTEAFPIVVYEKKLENNARINMEVMECEILPNGDRRNRTIFEYVIVENTYIDGKAKITGYHQKVNGISESLQKRHLENGMPRETINKFAKGGD